MSIIDAYDESMPILTPDKIYDKTDKITDTCIVTFSYHVIEKVLKEYENEIATYVGTANGKIPIYYLKEKNVLCYMSPTTASASATVLEEVAYITSVTNFIFFGSCGVLDPMCRNKVIVPIKSYRDEGFSYHYAKPSDYIDISNSKRLIEIFEKLNIEYVSGLNWTTDAIYKETINKVQKRKEEGCISVEMESSALQAISNYLNVSFYTFFFAGDLLASTWDPGNLIGVLHKRSQISSFELALKIAESIRK